MIQRGCKSLYSIVITTHRNISYDYYQPNDDHSSTQAGHLANSSLTHIDGRRHGDKWTYRENTELAGSIEVFITVVLLKSELTT